MGRYRKVDPRIWNDEKFRTLSDDGQLVFLFMMTHPHMTSLGAMRATLPGLASEKGWPEKRFAKAFREALAKAMLKHDPKASFVGLPNFLKYNPPESPNVVKSWSVALDLIPECRLKDELLQHVKDFTEAFQKAFQKALPKDFAKSMPYQEQEQEQEKKKPDPVIDTQTFDNFWSVYPRKKGKAKALESYTKALKTGTDATTILEAAKRYASEQNGADPKFTLHPTTWLNQGRWDDEPDPEYQEPLPEGPDNPFERGIDLNQEQIAERARKLKERRQ